MKEVNFVQSAPLRSSEEVIVAVVPLLAFGFMYPWCSRVEVIA